MNTKTVLAWLAARWDEPSSHNAISVVVLAIASLLPAPYREIALAIAGAFGINAFRKPEAAAAPVAVLNAAAGIPSAPDPAVPVPVVSPLTSMSGVIDSSTHTVASKFGSTYSSSFAKEIKP